MTLGVPYAIDLGSYMTHAGNTDHYNSSHDFRTIVGFPKEKFSMFPTLSDRHGMWIGDEALSKMGISNLEYPIRKGMVQDWDLFELYLEFTFKGACKIDSAKHPIVVSDSPFVSNKNRAAMVGLMFEGFNVPSFTMINCALATCVSVGRTDGTILTSSEGRSFVQSFYEGFLLKESIVKMEMGGHEIVEYLQQMLNQKGHSFKTKSDFENVRLIKEKLAFVKTEETQPTTKEYELPDGSIITLGSELYDCVEPLFQPHLVGMDSLGIHELVSKSIQDCCIDVRKALYANIVLAGGNTFLSNFGDRLCFEMKELAPPCAKMKMYEDPSRIYSTWSGMAIMSNFSSFSNMGLTKEYYEENGSSSMLRKCINYCG